MTTGKEAETGSASPMGYRGVSRTGGWAQGAWDAELRGLPRVVDRGGRGSKHPGSDARCQDAVLPYLQTEWTEPVPSHVTV